jgi:hypothetical protein
VSVAMNKHAAIEELLVAMFSMQSMQRLHSKDHQEKSASHKLGVGGWSQCLPGLSLDLHC